MYCSCTACLNIREAFLAHPQFFVLLPLFSASALLIHSSILTLRGVLELLRCFLLLCSAHHYRAHPSSLSPEQTFPPFPPSFNNILFCHAESMFLFMVVQLHPVCIFHLHFYFYLRFVCLSLQVMTVQWWRGYLTMQRQ